MQHLISVIVLNHNGRQWLEKCIPTIKKQTYSPIEIIVTDNASTDDSRDWLSKNHPDIKILKHDKNLGYAEANNLGAVAAKGEFVFFLNNDTELRPYTIERLAAAWKSNSVVTGHQLRTWEKDDEGSAGAGMDIFGYPYVEDSARNTRIFYADGAMIFVKKEDFMKIGKFDPELFIFEEDIDFSWRAQLFGYKIISAWDAHLLHYGGSTVPGNIKGKKYVSSYFRRYLNEKNIVRNILKNYSFPLVVIILVSILALHLAEIIILSILFKWNAVECYLKAYAWNIKNISDTLKYRRWVQKNRKISDFVLMKKMYLSYSKLRAFKKLGFPEFQ